MQRLSTVASLLLLMLASAHAQTFRGAINGSVTDPSGAVVPNARVVAKDTATAIGRTSLTTSDGQFAFQDLPTGTYQVTVTANGFPVFTVDNVAVAAGVIYSLPVRIALVQASTTVEVSAVALALDTTTEAQTTTVAAASLQDAPLNGRDFTQLIAVQPGFGGYSAGGFGSLNGTRPNQMDWQIDGVDNNDLWHNIPAVNQGGVSGIAGTVLPIDAVEEFSVQTQSSPEAGRHPGGTVNLVIKSGTNHIHGSAYYFNRNEAFSATPFFLPQGARKPEMRNEHWGGSLGAPIIKNRTFFFGAFENQKFTIGVQGLATEPSVAYQQAALDLMQYYGVPVHPVSAAMLKTLWPGGALQGAAASGNFYSTDPGYGYSYNGIIKVDHKLNDKNDISFRWFSGEGSQVAPIGSSLKYYFEVAPIHVQNYALVYNSAFSSRFSNQLLIGVNSFNQVFHDFNNSFETRSFGLYLSPSTRFTGAPHLIIDGFDQTGLTPPEGRIDITGHVTDVFSYAVGKHQHRFGGEYRRALLNEFYHRRALGSFFFDGTQGPWFADFLGNAGFFQTIDPANYDFHILALADYMAGSVRSSSIAVGEQDRLVYVNSFSLFFQDAWQLSPRLTVNYGIRYEYFGPLYNHKKDLSTFVPSAGALLFQGAGISSLYPADRKDFAPRFGFAYRPQERGNLVVRAGFGIYYDEPNLNPFLDNQPVNGGAIGIESNPAGADPISIVEVDNYTLPQGTYIFPAAGSTCPTGNGCGNVYNIFSVSQNFRTPYNYNYNLNVEQSLSNSLLLTLGYVGSAGRRLLTLADINQPTLGDRNTAQQRRPYFSQFPDFGIINQIRSNGTSDYNAFQATLKIKVWHGWTSQFAYTWAHAHDDMTYYRGALPQNSLDLEADYGNGDYDTRHSFTSLFSYKLPKPAKGPQWLLDGWQVGALLSFHTGQPFTVFADPDNTGTNENVQRVELVGDPFTGVAHRPVAVDGFKYVQWVNPAAFALPAPGASGSMRRNQIYGPGYGAVDFSVVKNFKVTERLAVQFRSEIYNLFNRVNLAPPNNSFAGPSVPNGFGQSYDTIGDYNGAPGIGPGEPLNVQFALKLVF